jgi:trk system potassium uptake protein TrkH
VSRPARLIVGAYALAVAVGTGLLLIPAATAPGRRTDVIDAVFTATSAVSVTGLAVVDTGSHWSVFGQVVILALMQVGGLGIMTLATLVTVLVVGRLAVRGRLLAQAETRAVSLTDIRRLLRGIVLFSLGVEAVVALILGVWFVAAGHEDAGRAFYSGVFHAVSAFNNGGLALYPDSLTRFVGDPVVGLTICLAVILGGLGYPVVFELARAWRRPATWSVLTRLTVFVTVALLGLGTLAVTLSELTNPATIGQMPAPQQLLAGFFHSTNTRSGGLNTVDIGDMRPATLFISDLLMFVGAGSAGTGGGIKVTTFGVLAIVLWSEMRGENSVIIGRRRIPESNQRQALAVALVSIAVVAASTLAMLGLSTHGLDRVLFEVISAFGTVGLSTGITDDLPAAATVLLTVLMLMGRIGPLTVATAMALRERTRRYDRPEERTTVG